MKEAKFICHVCGNAFLSRRAEIVHRSEMHNRKRHFPCDICVNVAFKCHRSLMNHMAKIHPGVEYVCKDKHGLKTVDAKTTMELIKQSQK